MKGLTDEFSDMPISKQRQERGKVTDEQPSREQPSVDCCLSHLYVDLPGTRLNIKELPVPDAVNTAQKAMEMARLWIVDGDQQIVLSPNLWKDPATWGLMLVDLAKHVANAYSQQGRIRAPCLTVF